MSMLEGIGPGSSTVRLVASIPGRCVSEVHADFATHAFPEDFFVAKSRRFKAVCVNTRRRGRWPPAIGVGVLPDCSHTTLPAPPLGHWEKTWEVTKSWTSLSF